MTTEEKPREINKVSNCGGKTKFWNDKVDTVPHIVSLCNFFAILSVIWQYPNPKMEWFNFLPPLLFCILLLLRKVQPLMNIFYTLLNVLHCLGCNGEYIYNIFSYIFLFLKKKTNKFLFVVNLASQMCDTNTAESDLTAKLLWVTKKTKQKWNSAL